jgi:mannosyltransferase OCH1-like enzyme
MKTIPKIIHQTAPIDENEWNPIWKECQNTWKNNFFNFDYVFWDDNDLRNLIKNDYPQFLNYYDSFPYKIIKIDFSRFCILHKYGGIYADMDIYCYKNFYNLLSGKNIYLIESWPEWNEKVQNSLMVSVPNQNFWIKCCVESIQLIESRTVTRNELDNDLEQRKNYILESCGPKLLSNLIDESVGVLPKELFNPKIKNQFNWANYEYEGQAHLNALEEYNYLNSLESEVITRHYLTGNWCKFI